MSASRFIESYRGTPPWDIGRPQPAFERLASAGDVARSGAGRRVRHGRERTGVRRRGLRGGRRRRRGGGGGGRACQSGGARPGSRVPGARRPGAGRPGRRFGTVVDSGLFHTFDDGERRRYVASLATATAPGARVHVLCFSEREHAEGGPRRVTQAELTRGLRAPAVPHPEDRARRDGHESGRLAVRRGWPLPSGSPTGATEHPAHEAGEGRMPARLARSRRPSTGRARVGRGPGRSMRSWWARAASASGSSRPTTGFSTPLRRPASTAARAATTSSGRALGPRMPSTVPSAFMRSRASTSTVPRLPTTTTRPRCASALRSPPRFTLARNSMMMSNPRPPVSFIAAVRCAGSRWSSTRTSP